MWYNFNEYFFTVTEMPPRLIIYRKTSNIRRTLVGKKIVDHSDVVGASPVGAAPTTSSFLDLTSGFKGFGKESRKTVREFFMCWDLVRSYIRDLTVVSSVPVLGFFLFLYHSAYHKSARLVYSTWNSQNKALENQFPTFQIKVLGYSGKCILLSGGFSVAWADMVSKS